MKKLAAVTVLILLAASAATAIVGGGEITLHSKGGNVLFSHDSHVGGGQLSCTECHDKLYLTIKQHKKVTMKQMQQGKSCGACHNGKKAFSVKGQCAKCHKK
ncbi:cytochrome c3 family protein [Geomonas subterranea]|uniref:Cytochrome c3 family protein n=1 Tax=Geomonas subterranea TaxID=2847989 RepID=A0ABX8LIC1_9BACT|nr:MULTISPECIES: cytochrome c3 family protein [Geomonas]QXE91427.1 cytochrome c3 family protein [Geomonas subterranea]QXM10485.1 cytochrome c3 family protein [Geomonas subterranea]